MSTMFERLRLQLKLRALKTQFGSDEALAIVAEAVRLEWEARDIKLPPELHSGAKKVPVSHQ